jgi:hypothetical protein
LAGKNPSDLAYSLKEAINLTKDHKISAKINVEAYEKRTTVKKALFFRKHCPQ